MNMIYRCMRPNCHFRFPAQTPSEVVLCPKCGGPVEPILPDKLVIPSHQGSQPSVAIELLLDNIRSAYNVGAILRTADCVGVNHLHFLGITPTPDHPKVRKTALGAETSFNWSQYWSYSDLMKDLNFAAYKTICLDGGRSSEPLFDTTFNFDRRLLLVIGNEIQGIDPEIIEQADLVAYLPMLGSKMSLNVSVACAVALYWLRFIAPTPHR